MRSKDFSPDLESESKKRNIIIKSSIIIIFILGLIALFLLIAYNNNKSFEYIKYKESGKIDYKVFLKENDFFDEEYLSDDDKYVASLINNVEANFNYTLDIFEKNQSYKYSYFIDSEVDVKDTKDKKVIYTDSQNLVNRENLSLNERTGIDINEQVKIDYNKYNGLISKFINTYGLENVESSLTVNMYVKLANTNENINNSKAIKVSTLEIPLNQNTIGIKTDTNIKNEIKNCLTKESKTKDFLKITAIIILVVDAIYAICIIKFYFDTQTKENIFEGKLNRIKYAYKGYIQKIDSQELTFESYQSVYVDSFKSLLEIRDTLQEPILMLENKKNQEVHFLIPSQTKIIYIYLLSADKIKKRLAAPQHLAITK